MVKYIFGSPEKLRNFIDVIDNEFDRVAILADVDLDGISSAIFLEKILEKKGINVEILEFERKKINFDKIEYYKSKRITKIFILDIPFESTDNEGFNLLNENFDVFEIDHHPFESSTLAGKKVLKTNSYDCTGLVIFKFGVDFYNLDEKEWAWLACAVAFSEFSYLNDDNLFFVQRFYPDFVEGNFSTSTPGFNARKISSALIYYENELVKIYNFVKEKRIGDISEAQKIIENEIDRKMETFFDNAEFFPEKKMYFYFLDSPYNIKSYLITMLSSLKKDYTFIIYVVKGDNISFSARNQSKQKDMNLLMKKSIEGLDYSFGGGHVAAAGAKIHKKDFEKFKNNLLNL